MQTYFSKGVPVTENEKFSKNQCPKSNRDRMTMRNINYSFRVGSLIYAQVCTMLDIAFAVVCLVNL